MNVNDSFWLASVLESRGFRESRLEEAALICINTCSVREKPELKVKSTVERIWAETKKNPAVLVCILGCVAKQEAEKCLTYSPQVRLVCAPDTLNALPNAIEELLEDQKKCLVLTEETGSFIEREQVRFTHVPPAAYVNIMQGCDNFCTYCIVPYTRGRQRSRDPLAVLAECKQKIALGAVDLTLLGQNVNAYGDDAKNSFSFAQLLESVSTLPGLLRVRYTSPHPKDMKEPDIAAFATNPKLCPSLHLPLQSGSSTILRRMARGYDRDRYLNLVESLRNSCPDIAITTDIIVGFPGETEADLNQTLSMMEACRFTSSYSFCYSDRPGTRASTFTDKIPKQIQLERLNTVQTLQEKLTQSYLASRIGTQTTILLEQKSKRSKNGEISWEGKDPYGIRVHVPVNDTLDHVGSLVPVTITDMGKHCLFGHSTQQPA